MRKLMTAAVLAFTVAGTGLPVLAANDGYVYVMRDGRRQMFDHLDLKSTSVCALKKQVADYYNLPMTKFDLMWGSQRLDPSKTLDGVYIHNGTELSILAMDYSFQCN